MASTVQQVQPPVTRPLVVPFLTFLALVSLGPTAYTAFNGDQETVHLRSRIPSSHIHVLQTQQTPIQINYFADKRNILNQLFVKRAWGWFTLVWFVYVAATYFSTPIAYQSLRKASLIRHIRRWFASTLFWYLMTQRIHYGFGSSPSLSHILLLKTGGKCVPVPGVYILPEEAPVCTGQRGEFYSGGLDFSGHTFILVHGMLFLFETMYLTLSRLPIFSFLIPEHPLLKDNDAIEGTAVAKGVAQRPGPKIAVYSALPIFLASFTMLFTTSLFFHSPSEKILGLLVGLFGWVVGSL